MKQRIFKWGATSLILFFITVWVVVFLGVSNYRSIDKAPPRPPGSIDIKTSSTNMIVKDLSTGKILYEKKSKQKTRPASLTKVMTALIVIERTKDRNKRITVPAGIIQELKGRDIATAGFKAGETVKAIDLIYGIIFESGADCCLTMAKEVAGSEKAFVNLMNQKAAALGMHDTTYGNSVGLDNPSCFTTVDDYTKLLSYALRNPIFKQVFTGASHKIPPTNKQKKPRTITNQTVEMFGKDKAGVFGGKRGYTPKAGLCLATVARIKGKEYICISTGAKMTKESSGAHVEDQVKAYKAIAN